MATTSKAESFMTQVEEKIRDLLKEFSEGKLNSEQFHVLYERYSARRLIAQQAMLTGDTGVLRNQQADQSTIAIKEAHMGKALGLTIYLNRNGAVIETLGDFNVSAFKISPILNEFRHLVMEGKMIRPRVERLEDRRWLLFAGERHTTVATLFRNEPSPIQMREIQRLQHDFEVANETFLEQPSFNSRELGYPFYAFVQRSLKK